MWPNTCIDGNLRFDAVYGNKWVLLARGDIYTHVKSKRGLNFFVVQAGAESPFEKTLDDLDTDAVLVRPDKYILGTARTTEEMNSLVENLKLSFSPAKPNESETRV